MSRPRVYQPKLYPHLIKGLYHEARCRRIVMTELIDEIVSDALDKTEGMLIAREEIINATGEQIAA